jgi:arylformamidase
MGADKTSSSLSSSSSTSLATSEAASFSLSDTSWTSELAETRFNAFDDAWLEREYSPSSAIGGNYLPYVTGYADRSAAVREALVATSTLGLRYGKAIRNIVDVFPAPTTDGSPSPALIFFHGGYWQESSLRDVSFPAAALNASGITYISIGYSLAPKATLTEIVEEACQAVRYIVDNASKLSVDPAHLVLGGHSAGAHLAAMCFDATVAGDAQDSSRYVPSPDTSRIVPSSNTALLLVSGIYELQPLVRTTINDALTLSQTEVFSLSPLRNPPICSRTAVVWGDNDTNEFAWQSRMFHQALGSTSPQGSHRQLAVRQRNHFDLIFDLADRKSELFALLRQLLGK